MKRLTFMMMIIMFMCEGLVLGSKPMGVFANYNTDCIQFLDPLTNTTTGPLLAGQLGSTPGGLLDVVITSDGKTAIVSNFGDGKLFFIDISGGFHVTPGILGSVRLPFQAGDLDITPDDKYVLVTDGGTGTFIGVVNIGTRHLSGYKNIAPANARAVAICPDGKTVVAADPGNRAAHAYDLQGNGTLIHKKKVRLSFSPVNAAVSPDGKTVIMPIAGHFVFIVLYFDAQGVMHYSKTVQIPTWNGQSCVFTSDGTKAYYLSNSARNGTRVIVLNISGPGQVTASWTPIFATRRGTDQLFGIDTIALDPSENYLYISNPTLSRGLNGIDVIDLALGVKVDSIKGTGIPTGIAFTTTGD